jgi:transcriptional regulator with XRE-family HTH domain
VRPVPLEPPVDARELADWLRSLKEQSGLSFAQIAREIGEEERNVKRWMRAEGPPTIPSGDVVLRLLIALGVTITPPPPKSIAPIQFQLRQIDERIAELVSRLGLETEKQIRQVVREAKAARPRIALASGDLEQAMEEVAALATEGLARVEAGIARVEQRLDDEGRPARSKGSRR